MEGFNPHSPFDELPMHTHTDKPIPPRAPGGSEPVGWWELIGGTWRLIVNPTPR
jgi:hypothetical protein